MLSNAPTNKEKILKKALFLILVVGFFVGIERFHYVWNEGFRVDKIHTIVPNNPAWDVDISFSELKEVENALNQNYYYLARGSQSFAFESEDGKYIIKFFKNSRWEIHPAVKDIPFPLAMGKLRDRYVARKNRSKRRTFESLTTAYNSLKTETGLIYLHLNKTTHLKKNLSFTDKTRKKYSINLDRVPFLLQKKAEGTDVRLLRFKSKGEIRKAEQTITTLINFSIMRKIKGFCDKDPHLIRNFGFIDEEPVQIDVGGFFEDPDKDINYFFSKEMIRIRRKMLQWIHKNYPELAQYVESQIKRAMETKDLLPANSSMTLGETD